MRRLLISSSGGETSAYMTWYLTTQRRNEWDEIVVVFANTGQENEATLEFIRDCDQHFGFNTVWLEAVQFPGERRAPSFTLVDFDTADRSGRVFEAHIAKYGIPNQKFKDCTRSMKRKPIESYAKALGWGSDYTTAIGIRSDEVDRVSTSDERRLYYPLAFEHPKTKSQINSWWVTQPFRLRLRGYQGNCKWCWKKTDRKHLTIMSETPEVYDFPDRMEQQYGLVGPEFLKDPATRESPLPVDYRRTFFRGNRSVSDMKDMYEKKKDTFTPYHDEAQVFDPEMDVGGGCEEQCEPYGPDDYTQEDDYT